MSLHWQIDICGEKPYNGKVKMSKTKEQGKSIIMAELWKREVPSNTNNPEDTFTAYRKISYNKDGMTALTTPEAEGIIRRAEADPEAYEYDERGFLHISQSDLEPLLLKSGYVLAE